MKRLTAKMLSLLLAVVMTVTLFPTGVKADTSPRKIGTVNYYSTGKGNNIITDSYLYMEKTLPWSKEVTLCSSEVFTVQP